MKHRRLSDLLALVSVSLFALCLVLVLLAGAGSYRRLVEEGKTWNEKQTASFYVTTRLRQGEGVTLEDFQGCRSLTMEERVGNDTYLTRVYCYDGFLRELYCLAGAALGPEDGEKVLPLTAMEAELRDGLLQVTLDGEDVYLYLPR